MRVIGTVILVLLAGLVLAASPAEPDPAKVAKKVQSLAASVSQRLEVVGLYEELGKTEDAARLREEARGLIEDQWHLLRDLHLALGGDGEIPPRPEPMPEPALPDLEQIKLDRMPHGYMEGRISVFDVDGVLRVLLDDDEEDQFRQAAADAIRKRLERMPPSDPRVSDLKVEIGVKLLSFLNDREEKQRIRVAAIFRAFWPGQYARIRYDPREVNFRERYKAWKEWRKYLQDRSR